MHVELAGALAPVLHDLTMTGAPVPRVVDDDWVGDPDRASAMLWDDASTHGCSVSIHLGAPRHEQVAHMADEVQDWVVDELWSGWPTCPLHPASHPLLVRVDDDAARWVCPRDSTAIAVVGALR